MITLRQGLGLLLIMLGLLMIGDVIHLEMIEYSPPKPMIPEGYAMLIVPGFQVSSNDRIVAYKPGETYEIKFRDPKETFTVICIPVDDEDVKVCDVSFNHRLVGLDRMDMIDRGSYVWVRFGANLTFDMIKGSGNPPIDYGVPIRITFTAYDSQDRSSDHASNEVEFIVVFQPYSSQPSQASEEEGGEEGRATLIETFPVELPSLEEMLEQMEEKTSTVPISDLIGYMSIALGIVMFVLGRKR